MDAMTRAVKMDLILDYFKQKDLAGVLYVDYNMHLFLPTIGLTYDDDNDYDQVLDTFKEKNLIVSKGSGYWLTDTGRTFKTFVNMEKLRLKQLILETISESFDTGKAININDILLLNCPEMKCSELGEMLRALSNHGYLEGPDSPIVSTTRSQFSIKKYIEQGNKIFLRISKEGYRYINKIDDNKSQSGSVYHISGSPEGHIIIGS